MEHSDEDGGTKGLGVMSGNVVRFTEGMKDDKNNAYKIPSMGWNQVYQTKTHPLWNGIDDGSRFYFVHSYFPQPSNEAIVATTTNYGVSFASSIWHENIYATQFHPEKSQKVGVKMLKNFIDLM